MRYQLLNICGQSFEFPQVADYRRGLSELDASQSISIKRWLLDLETTYAILQDTISKNYDRLFANNPSSIAMPTV